MKTALELDTGQRAFVRINGPDRRLMARLDAITATAKADMGARYDELSKEWDDCPFCEGTGRCHNNGEMDSPMWVPCDCMTALEDFARGRGEHG